MKLRVMASLVAVLALCVGSASAQDIGIFADQGGANCNIAAPQYVEVDFYVLAIGADALPLGLGVKGVEVRIDAEFESGFANGAILGWTPNPAANLVLGTTPLGTEGLPGGQNIAFPSCQAQATVLIGTIDITVTNGGLVNGTYFSVRQHANPTNANFQCPLINQCIDPTFVQYCVPGMQATLNGTDCTVAVAEKSWSEIKSLFN